MPSLRILSVSGPDFPETVVADAAAMLDRGGVIGLPTETVYGLCARVAHPDAVERIYRMKGRPHGKPLPFLIPDRECALNFVNFIPPRAQKLMDRFWPGPLTLVLGSEGGVALRLPDHPGTRAVLRRTEGPVAGTSANRSGEKPATTARRVERFFKGDLDLLVDAGKARLGVESSIVRIHDDNRAELLRVAHLSTETLEQALAANVVVLCTGNTCRSPMAAAVLSHLLARRLQSPPGRLVRAGIELLSAGLSAFPGSPMTREAEEALAEAGFPSTHHRSRPFSVPMAEGADQIFVMTASHRHELRQHFPNLKADVQLFDPSGVDIDDPFGLGVEDYRRCLDQIVSAATQRVDDILSRHPGTTPPAGG